jgi:8-oxo-dGTP diphosphatase
VTDGKLCLLLSPRKDPPYEGRPALPGKFIGTEESAEEAVQYLMDEMLPGAEVFREQLYTFTEVNRDPRGRVISIAYLAAVPWARLAPILPADGAGPRFFDVSLAGGSLCLEDSEGLRLIGGDLAFDHGRIIETGVQRLRGKIDYTDIAFHFLNDPRAFTLGELQAVYEAVLEKTVDGSNFRRTIQNRYEETGRIAQTDRAEAPRRRGRPPAIYRMTE